MNRLTYEQALDVVLPQACREIVRRYGRYGVTFDDAQQEMWVWLLQPGRDKKTGEDRVRFWLDQDPQWITSIRRAMVRYASRYGKHVKAEVSGYEVYDNVRYSEEAVKELLPLADDETFDGSMSPAEGFSGSSWSEELVVMVMDVRRAIEHTHTHDAAALKDWLNEDQRDRPGARRPMSNATSIAMTGTNELVARRHIARSN